MKISLKLWHLLALQILLLASLVWAADSRITDLSELTDGNVATGDFLEIVDVSDTTDNAAGSSRKVQVNSLRTRIFGAGSATAGSWPVFGSGTVLTTAEDGALEQDTNAFYLTTDAGNRGVVPARHCIRQESAYTLTSSASAQQLFNAATNGRVTLETGVYVFDGLVALTAMSATSGNATFDITGGTATLGTIIWYGFGRDAASDATTGTLGASYSTDGTLTAAPLVTAGTATTMFAKLEGTFAVTAGGTVQPRITLQTAATGSVTAGSYFCVNRIGSTSMTVVGQWD